MAPTEPEVALWQPEPDGEDSPAARWDRDAAKRALDELFQFTHQYRSGKSYYELLTFVARFRRYSPFNAMLIHIQKPGSTYVATPSRWQRDFDRMLKPGAQAIVILQPMGPVLFVYDVSDTDGGPLPREIESPFEVYHGTIQGQLQKTIANACRDGVRITKARFGSQMAGSIGPASSSDYVTFQVGLAQVQVPIRYDLLINESHSPEAQFATLVHELAHLYCGHLGTPNEKWWPDRRGLPLNVREFEAESVAYLVCQRCAIKPRSDEYLSGYCSQDHEIPPISLDCVMTAAGLIESMGRGGLKPRKEP